MTIWTACRMADVAKQIDGIAETMREHNDRQARIDYWRAEIKRLEAAAAVTPSGGWKMSVANERILNAQFALRRIERETE